MKGLWPAVILSTALFAADGERVYRERCASCHRIMLAPGESGHRDTGMKAPTMRMVAMRLKHVIRIHSGDEDIHRAVIVGFIKHYLEKPAEDYAVCMEEMIERYGVMPPQKGMTEEEKEAVADWVYDRF